MTKYRNEKKKIQTKGSVFTFQFLNDKNHNYVKKTIWHFYHQDRKVNTHVQMHQSMKGLKDGRNKT